MAKIHAFILGIVEFRRDLTTSYSDYEMLECYDRGRDLAHRLTLRRYDR